MPTRQSGLSSESPSQQNLSTYLRQGVSTSNVLHSPFNTMPTILITGAASGLGAAFVQAYLNQPGNNNKIIAIDKDPFPNLHLLPSKQVRFYKVDVSDESSIQSLQTALREGEEEDEDEHEPIDLILHCAGVRGLVPEEEAAQTPANKIISACESLEIMNLSTLTQTFSINAAGTFLLLRALIPHVQRAKGKVIVMSSRMGSIGNNQMPYPAAGASYAYRASKAAQNMLVRSLAVDVPDVTFVLCHPGRVETKLVKWKEEGAISAEESVRGLVPLIEKWGKEDSGKFYDRFGEPIQW